MAIFAIILGGFFGSVTALIALFGIGVDWFTGVTIYFATAMLFALPMIGAGMVNGSKTMLSPSLSDWESALHDGQLIRNQPIASDDAVVENPADRSAA